MQLKTDINKLIAEILNEDAEKIFAEGVEELHCYCRSLSIYHQELHTECVKNKIIKTIESIIVSACINFLDSKYVGYLSKDDSFYDTNLNKIMEIEHIKEHKVDIVYNVLEKIMIEFKRGREIYDETQKRRVLKNKELSILIPTEDVVIDTDFPVMERLEIEKIGLESKLSKLTIKQKERLLEIYTIFKLNQKNE